MCKKYILLPFIFSLLLIGCAIDAPPAVNATPPPEISAEPPPAVSATLPPIDSVALPPAASAAPSPTPSAAPSPTPSDGADEVDGGDFDGLVAIIETDPNRETPQKLKDAIAINSDVIGWLEIPNTNIDAPILHGEQWFYADHNIYREPDSEGCIISYYSLLTRNTIIQGKNMRKAGSGLHELHKLQDKAQLLAERENRLFAIDIQGTSTWEIFALYETTDSEPSETLRYNIMPLGKYEEGGENDKWIAYQKGRSELKDIIDVPVRGDDLLMTIITGGDFYEPAESQSRLYVFLKAVS